MITGLTKMKGLSSFQGRLKNPSALCPVKDCWSKVHHLAKGLQGVNITCMGLHVSTIQQLCHPEVAATDILVGHLRKVYMSYCI